ncbi:MAG: DUF4230 domain-containing protein [Bdellovibrionaceae bacterium]|nr:DUF4230 domain-containing protein [Pseudobdellovibrionaceae bacterium]
MKRILWMGSVLFLVVALGFAYQCSRWNLRTVSDEKLSVSFTSFVSAIRGLQRVQLAEVSSTEVIERTSEFSVFWDFLKLPDVVVQARIPVRYVYYVDLNEPFEIIHDGDRLIVTAPPLRAGAPAADVSGISYEVKRGSFFRSSRTAFEELRKMITPLLNESAEKNKALVQEEARRQLAALAKTWTLQSPELKSGIQSVEVRFQNEAGQGTLE